MNNILLFFLVFTFGVNAMDNLKDDNTTMSLQDIIYEKSNELSMLKILTHKEPNSPSIPKHLLQIVTFKELNSSQLSEENKKCMLKLAAFKNTLEDTASHKFNMRVFNVIDTINTIENIFDTILNNETVYSPKNKTQLQFQFDDEDMFIPLANN